MRILTLTQPWASLMALGHKRIETRSWSTRYRGDVAIHAAKTFSDDDAEFMERLRQRGLLPYDWATVPTGGVLAIVHLVEIHATRAVQPFWSTGFDLSDQEREFGNYGPNRWAWLTGHLRPLGKPYPYRGAQGLRELPPDIAAAILASITTESTTRGILELRAS